MSLIELTELMPPPQAPVESLGSWSDVELDLRRRLPDDYKAFIEKYGSGVIGEFLTVLNPFSVRPNLNLLEQSKQQLVPIRQLVEDLDVELPFELFPSPEGLLPVAITHNGDVVHWLTSAEPTSWTMVVNEGRSLDYKVFEFGFTSFITQFLDGSLSCRAFSQSVAPRTSIFKSI